MIKPAAVGPLGNCIILYILPLEPVNAGTELIALPLPVHISRDSITSDTINIELEEIEVLLRRDPPVESQVPGS